MANSRCWPFGWRSFQLDFILLLAAPCLVRSVELNIAAAVSAQLEADVRATAIAAHVCIVFAANYVRLLAPAAFSFN